MTLHTLRISDEKHDDGSPRFRVRDGGYGGTGEVHAPGSKIQRSIEDPYWFKRIEETSVEDLGPVEKPKKRASKREEASN